MSSRMFPSLVAALSLWLVGAASTGRASEGLPRPTGPVVLEVTGRIRGTNGGESARFDRHMLEALGTSKLRTSSAWTTGPANFEGVLVSEVLDAVGAEGSVVTATALNGPPSPARNWNAVPTGIVRQVPGARSTVSSRSP